jgi:type IX secretion system PorP/SprF family membrane protein
MKRLVSLIAVAILLCATVDGQVDPHFSMYNIYPSWVNPALTGAFDGDFRISGIYRNQWGHIENGFKTIGFSADAITQSKLNVGISVFQQTAGTGYTYQSGYANIAYTGLRFGMDGLDAVVLGLQAGFVNRKFDMSKFQTEDQWNNMTGFVMGAPSSIPVANGNSLEFDAGAGAVYYNMDPTRQIRPYIGFSVSHLTQPKDAFLSGVSKGRLPSRYTVHGGLACKVNEDLTIHPSFLYLRQGNGEEKVLGAYAEYAATEEINLFGGVNYRFKDAIVPFAAMEHNNLMLAVSYDVNNSDLSKTIGMANSFEISLSIILKKPEYRDYHNACPRL